MQPQIAVILPVYNGKSYLEQSIESVLSQSFQAFEFIICDDASTDNSYEIIEYYEHSGIKIYRNEKNMGLFPTLNKLISLSSAPLIHIWSQDDVMQPECLEKTLAFHALHTHISMSYSGRFTIDEYGKLLKSAAHDHTPELIEPQIYAEISAIHGCMPGNIANVTLARNFLIKTGYFKENLKVSGDFELWTRLARYHPIGFIKNKLVKIRRHSRQLSRDPDVLLYFLQEDLPIFEELYERLPSIIQPRIKKHYMRRYYTLYMNNVFYLLSRCRFKMAFQYFRILRVYLPTYKLLAGWVFYRIKK